MCRLDQEPMLGLHAASWSLGAGVGQGREIAGWVQHEASTRTGVGVLLNRAEGCDEKQGSWKMEGRVPDNSTLSLMTGDCSCLEPLHSKPRQAAVRTVDLVPDEQCPRISESPRAPYRDSNSAVWASICLGTSHQTRQRILEHCPRCRPVSHPHQFFLAANSRRELELSGSGPSPALRWLVVDTNPKWAGLA